jgi:hypothetical protein
MQTITTIGLDIVLDWSHRALGRRTVYEILGILIQHAG